MGTKRKSIVYHPPIRKSHKTSSAIQTSKKVKEKPAEIPRVKKSKHGWALNISPNAKRQLCENLRTPESFSPRAHITSGAGRPKKSPQISSFTQPDPLNLDSNSSEDEMENPNLYYDGDIQNPAPDDYLDDDQLSLHTVIDESEKAPIIKAPVQPIKKKISPLPKTDGNIATSEKKAVQPKKRKKRKAITFEAFNLKRNKKQLKGPAISIAKSPRKRPTKLRIIDGDSNDDDDNKYIPNNNVKKKTTRPVKKLAKQLSEKHEPNYIPMTRTMPLMGGYNKEVDITFSLKNLNWVKDNDLKLCECLSTRTFKQGYLKISPHGQKEMLLNTYSWITFVVLMQGVTLTMSEKTKYVDTHDMFHVPPFAEYGLENNTDETVLLYYYVNFAC